MITIKSEFRQQALRHRVDTCDGYAVYSVNTHDANGVTQLMLYKGNDEPIELLLYAGTKAYAMNDYGATIDTISGTSMPKELAIA